MATVAENLLYECIRELSYVQDGVEGCKGGLCASANGAELIERGQFELKISQLAEDTLDAEREREAAARGASQ